MKIWRNVVLAAAGFVLAVLALDRLFPPPLDRAVALSALVTDRDGRPLRAFPAPEGRWRFAADLDAVDPLFVEALLAVEDKRFRAHPGVDALALIRAMADSAAAGRIVSGGSTITMQTARLLEPRRRTIGSKLLEIARAIQIEARLSKREILELYLTFAPYGGNLEGLRAASWAYFGHAPDRLSDDEITLLIALPQAPEARRPDRRPDAARAGRARVAALLREAGVFDDRRVGEVVQAPTPTRQAFPATAWHAAAAARGSQGGGDVRSTLDAGLQGDLERLLREAADARDDAVQFAALVVEVETRAVRAAVGSAARDRPGGWLDLTDRPRSPGSTLKPFIYGMAFDDGAAAPETRVSDLPKRFAAYRPENFDREFNGEVTVSEALQHSLNVPAVIALDRVGPARFAAHLAFADAPPKIFSGAKEGAGLALALGGAGLTARSLVTLYAALGDSGRAKPLAWTEAEAQANDARSGVRLLSPDSAAKIRRILADGPPPAGRAPGRLTANAPQIAFKTGTSYGFRDAWAAGVAGRHAIVVWVGRADGAPRPGKSGRSEALPLLFDIADRAALRLRDPGEDAERMRVSSPARPGAGQTSLMSRDKRPQILFPPADADLWVGDSDDEPSRGFVLAGQGQGPLDWFVNGAPCPIDAGGAPVWRPEFAGFYVVSAVDKAGRESRVRVRVLGPPPA